MRLRRSECSGACAACRDAAARIRSHGRTRHASDRPDVPPPSSGRGNAPSRVLTAYSGVLKGYSTVLQGTNQVLRGVSHQRLTALHCTRGWRAYGSDCVADHGRPRSPSIMNAAHFCHSQRFQRTAAGMHASTSGDRRSAIGSDRRSACVAMHRWACGRVAHRGAPMLRRRCDCANARTLACLPLTGCMCGGWVGGGVRPLRHLWMGQAGSANQSVGAGGLVGTPVRDTLSGRIKTERSPSPAGCMRAFTQHVPA